MEHPRPRPLSKMKIKLPNTHRLHALRMESQATGREMDEHRERFQRIDNRHEDGTAPRAVTSWQLFQTPPAVASRLAELLNLAPGARILEPSAGLGRLLDAVRIYEPGEIVAIEKSADVAAELNAQAREGVRIICQDFLTVEPMELGAFDAVIMNPPFHMREDIRHIEHARTFLKKGGTLAAVCMDTDRREAMLRPDALTWEPLPPGAFRSVGTNVPVVLCTFTL